MTKIGVFTSNNSVLFKILHILNCKNWGFVPYSQLEYVTIPQMNISTRVADEVGWVGSQFPTHGRMLSWMEFTAFHGPDLKKWGWSSRS